MMDGFKIIGHNKAEKNKTGRDNSFNVANSEFFKNLNPVTKQYLKQIENAYVNSGESITT